MSVFGGMRVIVSAKAVDPVLATIWVEPPYSPHRSKRLWKKLRKRTAEPHPGHPACYEIPGNTLVMHPAIYQQVKERCAA